MPPLGLGVSLAHLCEVCCNKSIKRMASLVHLASHECKKVGYATIITNVFSLMAKQMVFQILFCQHLPCGDCHMAKPGMAKWHGFANNTTWRPQILPLED
jgi:hypothetical protein